jgi:hypothetical protein
MTVRERSMRRITVSLPSDLLEFTDEQARCHQASRSQIIGKALCELKAREEERLAAEGYQFYADEACEFAAACGLPAGKGLDHAG